MGRRIKAWNALSLIIFLAVFAASLGVFWLTRTGGGYIDFIINVIFDLIAFCFLMGYIVGCAGPLGRVVSGLARTTAEIQDTRADARTLWNRYSSGSAPFGVDALDRRFSAYVRELRRMQKQNAWTADCALEDYIDESLIYSTVNKSFCDQVGGIMSGLGVLFTFIGLVYGLRNFDASSVDVMQSSTQALMAGIKVAFLTSIFGLIYSLLFSLFYKKLLKNGLEALYDFQDTFAERVRPDNAHGAENAMLRLQQEQNEALQSFGATMGEQVSEAIIALMGPTVDKLQSTITQYVTVAIEDQRAGMEKVVRYFLESMNASLGDIFVQLRARTEELVHWQQDMTDAIQAMIRGMGSTTENLTRAETSARRIADTMAAYTDGIQALTDAQRGVTAQMEQLMSRYQASRDAEAALAKVTADNARAAADAMADSLRSAQAIQSMADQLRRAGDDSARAIADAGTQIGAASESIRAMAGDLAGGMDQAAARLGTAADELKGDIRRDVGESLSLMEGAIARLNEAVENMSASLGGAGKAISSLPKTAAGVNDDIRSTAKVIDTELKLLLKAVSDTQKLLTRFNADLERRMDR